ncbi:MAG TPA: cytochrome c [Vicinamibacterales bacterium]
MRAVARSLAIVLLACTVAAGFEPRGLKPPRYAPEISRVGRAGAAAPAATALQNPQSAPAGNATRGKSLFDKTLRCYACHGFDGQTGNPRLVPMARTEDAFITYLRKPATPAMPAFADVPRQDLVDVYAYIRSLKVDAPAADSIPLLRDLIDRANKTAR